MNAPEKIHNVSQTQFSIARYYGGIKFNGYTYRYNADDDTLTREDIVMQLHDERERFAKAERKKAMQMREKLKHKQDWIKF
jgi:hypothetical protein